MHRVAGTWAAIACLLAAPFLRAEVRSSGAGEVLFTAPFPGAGEVRLAGEFNDWNAWPIVMERTEHGFSHRCFLDHGLHEYKFIVDGQWLPDPDNPARTTSDAGQPNSAFWLERDGHLVLRADVPDTLALDTDPLDEALPLVILWQQHQPWLGDPDRDELLGPWLRLHATKDYLDMALRLKDQPAVRAGISLSGTLVFQLDRYYLQRLVPHLDHDNRTVARAFDARWTGRCDPWLDLLLARQPDPSDPVTAGLLWRDDWSCLSVSPPMLERWPRLKQLADGLRAGGVPTADEASELVMLFHLAWMDPRFLREAVPLCTGDTLRIHELVRASGQDRWQALAWDGAARRRLAYETGLVLKAILPEHRALMGAPPGVHQVELATTPFAHPILPLLLDTRSAAARQPGDSLPDLRFTESARLQVQLAMAQFTGHIGRPPLGFWPGEGALDLPSLQLLAEAGLEWTATGDNMPSADLPGIAKGRLCIEGRPVVLLRATALSRSLGWRYRLYPGQAAATDLVNRLLDEGRRQPGTVLVLVLDGENAWEFYQRDPDGDAFLDGFYALLAEEQARGRIRTLAPSEAALLPGQTVLNPDDPALGAGFAAGSWINGDLRTWIGEPEENRAWQLLSDSALPSPAADAAELALQLADPGLFQQPGPVPDLLAQGSDWFWWYGADRQAFEGDRTWDRLFLALLRHRNPLAPLPETLLDSTPPAGPGARTLD
jgi:alpha-amylase/alpha-mannosidase (GH57 family)